MTTPAAASDAAEDRRHRGSRRRAGARGAGASTRASRRPRAARRHESSVRPESAEERKQRRALTDGLHGLSAREQGHRRGHVRQPLGQLGHAPARWDRAAPRAAPPTASRSAPAPPARRAPDARRCAGSGIVAHGRCISADEGRRARPTISQRASRREQARGCARDRARASSLRSLHVDETRDDLEPRGPHDRRRAHGRGALGPDRRPEPARRRRCASSGRPCTWSAWRAPTGAS